MNNYPKRKFADILNFFCHLLFVSRLVPCARREDLSAVCFPKFCFFACLFRFKDMLLARGSVFCMLKVWAMSLSFHIESNCLRQVNKQIKKYQARYEISERAAIIKAWLFSFFFFNDHSIQSCEAFHYYLVRRDYHAIRICRLKLTPAACSFFGCRNFKYLANFKIKIGTGGVTTNASWLRPGKIQFLLVLNGSVILSYIDFHCHDACFSPLFFWRRASSSDRVVLASTISAWMSLKMHRPGLKRSHRACASPQELGKGGGRWIGK